MDNVTAINVVSVLEKLYIRAVELNYVQVALYIRELLIPICVKYKINSEVL